MKVTFCGATKTVTGSNFLVEGAGKKFLVDCGLYQGGAKDEIKNEEPFPYDINEIDFMLLTHAHIDHSGRIPKLYKEGYRNPIYATNATCDLCAIMLPDSGHIQETETEWKNRKRIRRGEEELVPIYDAETAAKSLELFKGEPYNQIIELDDDIHVRFNDAGHMLGSSTIEIWIRENGENKKIVFSGDLGNNDIPLLAEPTMIQDADFLVMESTYGNRLHIKNESKAETFINIVTDTIKNGGTVVIPSFAVGRTQEILYELNKIKDSEDDSPEFERKYRLLMNTPVYVDSPLAISATEVFKENMDLFDKETQELIKRGDNPLEFPGLKFTQTVEESKALNESDESAIIISASGMCEVGRIKHHLKHNIWNPKNTILFVGYQAPGTLGRKIVDGAKTVKIFGEEESQKVLRDKINENFDLPVSIPDYCESFDLTNTVQATGNIRKRNLDEYRKLEVIDRLETLKEELVDMESIVKEDILANTVNDDEISKLNERIKELEKQIVEIVENK